jgi:uncharacterized protein YkwD
VESDTLRALAAEIVRLTNIERVREGVLPLIAMDDDSGAVAAANVRAEEIFTHWSHTRPNGTAWHSVLGHYNVSYERAGENLSRWLPTPAEVVETWMTSIGHRTNLLREEYTHVAVGVAFDGSRFYWSQIFLG